MTYEPTDQPMSIEQRNGFLTLLGIGPRECADCGEAFTPPPYLDFKDMKVCRTCGYKRFQEFCEKDEGQQQLKEALARLQESRSLPVEIPHDLRTC